MGRKAGMTVAVALLAFPGPAAAHEMPAPVAATALAPPAACPGETIAPDHVITGDFGTDLEGSYVLLPFEVSAGMTAVRVKYCYDQPEAPTSAQIRNTLDLGLYEAPEDPGAFWSMADFRGWGGSSHPDVIVSPEGFKSEAEYRENPRSQVAGKTTRAFRPGPIPPGRWAVELGVAAVTARTEGDSDGRVAWRVEIELSDDPAFADEPYEPAPYDPAPARTDAGWYAGDMHVHGEHSALGDAPMSELFDFAFGPLSEGKAGLDFVTLSDYVSGSAWGEIGRHQAGYPGKLIVRSAEVITYRGHVNNHATAAMVDYRTGPLYELTGGGVELRREPRPASAIFDEVLGARGFTQINHPTIFPSEVPGFDSLCRGCPWDYSDAETDYSKVDAIEIATGPAGLKQPPQPGPNPFTPLAVQFWEDALDLGHKIAAVGSSDSHNAGRTPDAVTQSPIGQATTVVYASELSEKGIQQGIEAGHTYVKIFGNDRPDLRFEATAPGSDAIAIMGDTVYGGTATFLARVLRGAPAPDPTKPGYELVVVKDGAPLFSVPVTSGEFAIGFPSVGVGRYRLQLQRGSALEAVSSPIYLEAGPPPPPPPSHGGPGGGAGGDPGGSGRPGFGPRSDRGKRTARLSVRGMVPRSIRARRGRFGARCAVSGRGRRTCAVRVIFKPRGGRARRIGLGRTRLKGESARVPVRLTRAGQRLLRRRGVRVTLVFTGTDLHGARGTDTRRARLRLGEPRRKARPT